MKNVSNGNSINNFKNLAVLYLILKRSNVMNSE